MNEDDFTGWTDEQIRNFVLTGQRPDAKPAVTEPAVNAPPGEGAVRAEQRRAQMEAASPTGSFGEGFRRGAASAPFGVARLAGIEGAEDVAKMHGAEMAEIRKTPFGSAGATAANVLTGLAAMPARGYAAVSGAGGALEALQDIGEGKTGIEGFGRGAVGGFLGNWLANTMGVAKNVASKKAFGKEGLWGDNATEEVYDFAKSIGVDLRPGDLPGRPVHQGVENLRYGVSGLENQSAQLYQAMFGRGDKNEILSGFQRVDNLVKDARDKLWSSLDQIPDKTTVSPTGLLTALENAKAEYPKIISSIENARLREKLNRMVTEKAKLTKQYDGNAARAHREVVFQNELTFDEVREILKKVINPLQIKMSQKAAEKKASPYLSEEVNSIKDAINGDLKRWGHQNPDKYAAYQEVLDVYKTGVLPYEQNPYIMNWRAKAYDGNPELLVRDLLDENKKTARNTLIRDYIAPADKDTLNYLRLIELANRGSAVIAGKAQGDQVLPANLLSPMYTAARVALHKGAGRPWMTPVTGASNRIFSTQPGPLSNRLEGGVRGGLGLSWQELAGERSKP